MILVIALLVAGLPSGLLAQIKQGPNPPKSRQVSAPTDDLLAAAKTGDTARVEALLARGFSPNVTGPNGWTPLMFAALEGHTDAVVALIGAGATIDAMSEDGATPLMAATLKGHTKIVSLLLDHGAQVTLKNKDGVNAFIIAKEKGFTPIIELMSGGFAGWSRDAEGRWIRSAN